MNHQRRNFLGGVAAMGAAAGTVPVLLTPGAVWAQGAKPDAGIDYREVTPAQPVESGSKIEEIGRAHV